MADGGDPSRPLSVSLGASSAAMDPRSALQEGQNNFQGAPFPPVSPPPDTLRAESHRDDLSIHGGLASVNLPPSRSQQRTGQ